MKHRIKYQWSVPRRYSIQKLRGKRWVTVKGLTFKNQVDAMNKIQELDSIDDWHSIKVFNS